MSYKKFVVCSDFHGDKHDRKAVSAFYQFVKHWKPNIKIFAGDLWDFRPIRKGAEKEEKREIMGDDLFEGENFLDEFQPHYFLRGNHDERLWDLREIEDGVIGDFAREGCKSLENKIEKMKCRMLPYNKRYGILKIGHLKILHGYCTGVYSSRKHAQIYGSCLYGHTHAIDEHAIEGQERRVARNIGCLCDLDMEYARAKPGAMRWAHGWAYGVIYERSGLYYVWQAENIGGRYIVPSDLKEIK